MWTARRRQNLSKHRNERNSHPFTGFFPQTSEAQKKDYGLGAARGNKQNKK